jgi:exodeoxyribonuclease V gamma subunit
MLAGARALEAPRAAPERFLDVPLEPVDATMIDLEDLVRFVQHPVRAFLRRRLTIYLDEIQDEVDDALPIELEGLERWGIGQRLLDAVVVGTDGRSACLAEIARGTLPPGALGEPVLRKLYPVVQAIRSAADALAPADAAPAPLDVRVTLPDGRLLSGTVATRGGDLLLTTTFSRVAAKHRLSAWVRLLAATASAPHLALSAATVGRGAGDADVTAVCIDPLAVDPAIRRRRALAHLATVVDLYDRGMREPLPVFCRSSAAFAAAALAGEDPVAAAREQWQSRFAFSGDDQEL